MGIQSSHFVLGTVAGTLIVPSHHNPQRVTIHNQETSNSRFIYLGGSDVTALNSIHLDSGDTYQITLSAGDSLYARASDSDVDCGVLRQTT